MKLRQVSFVDDLRIHELHAVWTPTLAGMIVAQSLATGLVWLSVVFVVTTVLHVAGTMLFPNAGRSGAHRSRRRSPKTVRSGVLRLLLASGCCVTGLGLLLLVGFVPVRGNGLFPLLGGLLTVGLRFLDAALIPPSVLATCVRGCYRASIFLTAGLCARIELPIAHLIGIAVIALYAAAIAAVIHRNPKEQRQNALAGTMCLIAIVYAVWLCIHATGGDRGWLVASTLTLGATMAMGYGLSAHRRQQGRRYGIIVLSAGACLLEATLIAATTVVWGTVTAWLMFGIAVVTMANSNIAVPKR